MARIDIPSDWQVLPLGQLAQIERGKFSTRPRNDPRYYGGTFPFIQTGDVRNSGGLITSYSQTLNERGLKVSKLFPAGTLFMTIAANIGDMGVTDFASACPDSLVAVRPRPGVDQLWLYYALSARKADLESIATQNAQANLNLEKLNPFLLVVPPHPEQVAMATMLHEVSQSAAGIERQIAKKQAVKQGMLQQLLTGRTRLPGYEDPWVERRVADIATIAKGTQLSRAEMDQSQRVPVWNGGIEPSGFTSAPNVRRAVVTVSEGGNSCGWVGRPAGEFWLGGHCYALDPRNEGHSVEFLYHRLKMAEARIMDLRVGSGLPNIQKKRLGDFVVVLPSDPAEASAIAQVLEDADRELGALRARLAKAQAIKIGVMQQLLTGRMRLPAVGAAA